MPALVLIACRDAGALCRKLALEAGLLVLAVETRELDVAVTAVEWTADHAAQLGGDPPSGWSVRRGRRGRGARGGGRAAV